MFKKMLKRIAWFEPFWVLAWGVALLLPARFVPAAAESVLMQDRPWFVLALGFGWLVRWIAYGRFSRPTPIDLPLLFILLWLPVNFWASADKSLSWIAIGYLIFDISLYLALLNWPPIAGHPEWIAWGLLLFGAGLVATAPLLTQLTTSKLFTLSGLAPLLTRLADMVPGNVHLNRMAGALVVLFPLFLALGLRWDWTERRWLPPLNLLLATGAAVILFLTQSRGAYLGAATATMLLLVLRWRRLAVALPLIIVVAVFVFTQIGIAGFFAQVPTGNITQGIDGRMEVWSRGIYALTDFPFTGIGIGTFDLVIPLLYPYFLIGPNAQIGHAHNIFIQVGLDLGFPGLIAFLALYINVFATLAVVLRQRQFALPWTLAAGAAGGLIAMFVHGLLDVPLWGTKPSFLPWLLIALALALGAQSENRASVSEEALLPQ